MQRRGCNVVVRSRDTMQECSIRVQCSGEGVGVTCNVSGAMSWYIVLTDHSISHRFFLQKQE